MRECERWTAVTMNVCTKPMFDRYIERLDRQLADLGWGIDVPLCQSSSATIPARRLPRSAWRRARAVRRWGRTRVTVAIARIRPAPHPNASNTMGIILPRDSTECSHAEAVGALVVACPSQ